MGSWLGSEPCRGRYRDGKVTLHRHAAKGYLRFLLQPERSDGRTRTTRNENHSVHAKCVTADLSRKGWVPSLATRSDSMSRGFLSSLTGRRHLLQHVPTLKCGATFLLSGTRCVRILLTLRLNARIRICGRHGERFSVWGSKV